MKKLSFILFSVIILHSCMSYNSMLSIIPEQTASEIPLNAEKILIENSNLLNDNYLLSYKTLLKQDFKIENDNKELGYISASKKVEGDTNIRLNIVCENNTIQITSEWKPGAQTSIATAAMTGINVSNYDWQNAKWNKKADKSSLAFAKTVLFAKEISNVLIYKGQNLELPAKKQEVDKFADPIYN